MQMVKLDTNPTTAYKKGRSAKRPEFQVKHLNRSKHYKAPVVTELTSVAETPPLPLRLYCSRTERLNQGKRRSAHHFERRILYYLIIHSNS